MRTGDSRRRSSCRRPAAIGRVRRSMHRICCPDVRRLRPPSPCSPTSRWARTASTSTSWSDDSSNCTTTWSGVDDVFDYRTADAVMAFHKVQGMARTQTVDAATWRALGTPKLFVPRHREDGVHIEVDQTRQVLAVVRDGDVEAIIHVSTGKPSTPDARRVLPRLLEARGVQREAAVLPELLRRGAGHPRVDRRPQLRGQSRMCPDPVLDRPVDVRSGPDRNAGLRLPLIEPRPDRSPIGRQAAFKVRALACRQQTYTPDPQEGP